MKIQIKVKSIDQKSLSIYLVNIQKLLKTLKISYNIFNLPTKQKRITLLKSPHVNITAREQFEIKTYKTLIQMSSFNKFKILKLLSLNKPKTVVLSIKNY
jgi:small subunit ribosomal protein S10